MNAAETFLRLLRVPARRPRTLLDVAAELAELAGEVHAYVDAGDMSAPLAMTEASAFLSKALARVEIAAEAEHDRRLARLEVPCAHCGHAAGDHLVDGGACEHEHDASPPTLEPCKCAAYTRPGLFAVAVAVGDTERPPPMSAELGDELEDIFPEDA